MSESLRYASTDDRRVARVDPLPPPEHLIRFFPIEGTPIESHIQRTRDIIARMIPGNSDRLLVVVGPCSIHDPVAAIEYAHYAKDEREKHKDTLEIVMRTYFEKPRTTVGWKGLINDPHLDESFLINVGLRMARELLYNINRIGVPTGAEFLDTISPQYFADLISWGAIGARTTESQVHRELVSGLSCPVGFKNGTDGNIQIAVDAMRCSKEPHHFPGTSKSGQIAMIQTRGNSDTHIILRGMSTGTNYDRGSIEKAVAMLREAGVSERVMIDVSHGNSQKEHRNQGKVIEEVARQVEEGNSAILGAMIESHLVEGSQKHVPGKMDPSKLVYGQSITDGCIGRSETSERLDCLSEAVRSARGKSRA